MGKAHDIEGLSLGGRPLATRMRGSGIQVERPTRAVIDLGAIAHNIAEVRKQMGDRRRLMAVVKADAYGHGSVEVSWTALRSGADCLGVAIPEEGAQLREAGIEAPILVLGLIQPQEAYKAVDAGLEQTVCSLELAEALDQEAGRVSIHANVHIKVDTGMGRIGVKPQDVCHLAERIRRLRNLNLVGVFSHFASADEADKTSSKRQIEIFDQIVRQLEAKGFDIPQKHMANSAGILDLPQSHYDLVRPGIILYGLYPSNTLSHRVDLRPAMSFQTRIAFLKWVPPGTPISYGQTFVTRRKTRVATLPVGYADGYRRLLSGRSEVLIRGRRAPLIGRICMDMCMADVSHIPHVRPGDDVVLFGRDPSADEIASMAETINYEILCGVGKRVPRIYVR